MDRYSDGPGLVGDCPGYGLPDPPSGVSRKLEAATELEFLNRLYEPHVAFLDKVKKLHPASHISLGDGYHEAQVGFDETALSLLVAHLHPLRQLDFFFGGKKGHPAYLLEVHADRVVQSDPFRNAQVYLRGLVHLGALRHVFVRVSFEGCGLSRFGSLVILLVCLNGSGGMALLHVQNLDPEIFKMPVDIVNLLRRKIQLTERVGDF